MYNKVHKVHKGTIAVFYRIAYLWLWGVKIGLSVSLSVSQSVTRLLTITISYVVTYIAHGRSLPARRSRQGYPIGPAHPERGLIRVFFG